MAEITAFSDNLNENDYQKQPIPSGINVLTILTFIGCAIGLCLSVFNFFNSKHAFETKDAVIEKMNSGTMPAWAKSMMPDMSHFEELVTKSYENRLPILLLSLIAIGLCFFGALQMRKRKKQGFMLYVIGELVLPVLLSAFFIGTFTLTGGTAYFGYGIAILFILLYAAQRKHLV